MTTAVVLVEGSSDRAALETLALRRGRNLDEDGVKIVAMGGATNIRAHLERYRNHTLAGLCDAGEEGAFVRALERTGFGAGLDRAGMERLGFYVCVEDLEDELIRALGARRVEEIIAGHGEIEAFRTFQKQPQWRERRLEEQLRRFFGTHSGRKAASAPLLVEALDLDKVPHPLDGVLAYV